MHRRVPLRAFPPDASAASCGPYLSALLCAFLVISAPIFSRAQVPSQCNIPSATQSMFSKPPQAGAGIVAFRMLGNSYQNFGCLDQADTAYRQMAEEAKTLPDKLRTQNSELAQLHLEFTAGLRSWSKGDFNTALQAFSDVTEDWLPSDLTTPGLHAYAQAMMTHFDPARWAELKPRLEAWNNQGFWSARLYLTFCGLTPATAEARLAELRDLLLTDLPTESRLADQVILIDLFVRTGHLLEADLMIRSVEPDIGALTWDRELRMYFLRISATLYSGLAQQGNSDAAARAQFYQKAIGDLNAGI